MKNKLISIIFLIAMLILLQPAYPGNADNTAGDYVGGNIFHKGDLSFSLDKETYGAGDVLKAEINAANLEEFPVPDAYIVIEIVSGDKKHVYPSMQSDLDNVLYEEIIRNITLAPLSQKTVQFSYKIPSDIKTGNYRFEAYLLTPRTPLVGIPHIFLSPEYQNFFVTGTGTFPRAHISRTSTVFASVAGPVGAGVNKSGYVTGTVSIQSDSLASLKEAKLKVTVCEWDDTSCMGGDVFYATEYPVPEIAAKASVEIAVKFSAPKNPEAYSIRLELTDSEMRTLSLYRNRIIVYGETARIRKMAIDSSYYKKGQEGNITLLIGASPDHYNYPHVKNAVVSISLKDNEGIAFSNKTTIPDISIDTGGGLLIRAFAFTAERDLDEYALCAKIESDEGTVYDEYCYNMHRDRAGSTGKKIVAEWAYNYDYGILDVNICSEDISGAPASSGASAFLLSYDEENLLGQEENKSLNPCQRISYKVPIGTYMLRINDLENGRQTNQKVRITAREKAVAQGAIKAICGDGKCEIGEESGKCCIDCGCPSGRNCAGGICIKEPALETCGNGVCGASENPGNCCIDCDCPFGKTCNGDACATDKETGSYSKDGIIYYAGIGLITFGVLLFLVRKKPGKKQAYEKNKTGGL
ncbi:MAG: hypothetical protein WAX07_09760 [Candidatus Altiarchaeia archaeon]